MTYVLNALVVDGEIPQPKLDGGLLAEPDDPPGAVLLLDGQMFEGVRYLIVQDDGSGYRSSMSLVSIPEASGELSVLQVPASERASFRHLLSQLLLESPAQEMLVYLEANRGISRPSDGDEHPVQPSLRSSMSLQEFTELAEAGRLVEDDVYVVTRR